MLRIYLAGLINPNVPMSYEWRKEVIKNWGVYFKLVNPISSQVASSEARKTEGMLADTTDGKTIVMKDWFQIERADIILVNLDEYRSTRPLTGTLFEIAWAWKLQKPVVAFGEDIKTDYRDHPFVVEAVTSWHETWGEALNYIHEHYEK